MKPSVVANEINPSSEHAVLETPSQSPLVASSRLLSESTPRQRNTTLLTETTINNRNPSKTQSSVANANKKKVLTRTGTMAQLPLPKPRESAKCPVFCCFYAEFDNQIGPTIVFQSPKNFMDLDIGVPMNRVHKILDQAFRELQDPSFLATNTESVKDSNNKNSRNQDPNQTDDSTCEQKLSIFDSCSEYIITGNELSGNVIKLSAHDMHLVTHPTVIVDNAYERNSLLFSVGFVLRRSIDSRPFQPIISKWAKTLREVEKESQYLSNPVTRCQIQSHTEQLFVSLNSLSRECSLLINPAHVLHLKLFHPPRVPAFPVPDYAVPVLLLRDWRQCQVNYDWDLAIDWCGRHIDGVKNAQQISEKAEVDMEMVRACLRVLKHHGVIALCDMFFYSNRYEATERAIAMLAGHEPQLLVAAAEHAARSADAPSPRDGSPALHAMASSPGTEGSISSGSRTTVERIQPGTSRLIALPATPSSEAQFSSTHRRGDLHDLKLAVAEFFSRCERSRSFGDTWIALVGSSCAARATGDNTTTTAPPVDWKRAFRLLDHRRLVTFGVVHGLIRRVHRVPRVLRRYSTQNSDDQEQPLDQTEGSEIIIGPLRQARRRSSGGSSHSRKKFSTASISSKMDGLHCDDELVCEFQVSFDELLELVGEEISISLVPATCYGHY
ncbi:hypothetical protein ACA910_001753 [Epithemia clementina (nom. ined.)]